MEYPKVSQSDIFPKSFNNTAELTLADLNRMHHSLDFVNVKNQELILFLFELVEDRKEQE
ncbi:hypothetical protein [Helicobacter bizzozeronii]|uniref:hypothetical protein n=1 Tax=Helicobacter bizzozeronii TaxID=56877 RepID=UPI001F375339|nr:hypothetical protein [Helicobacter bizzozeronii]